MLVAEEAAVIVGVVSIFSEKALPVLTQPAALVTVSVPLYVPEITPAATGIFNGLAVMASLLTFTSPAAKAAPFHVIEYCVGLPVLAL